MKLACSSMFFTDPTYVEKLQHARRLGYEGIEVRLEESPELDQQSNEIVAAHADSPVKVAAVVVRSPAYRAPLDSEEARVAKLSSARTALQIAARLGVGTLVQPEYVSQNPPPSFYQLQKPTNEEKERLYRFLTEAADYAEKVNSKIMLEPINRYEGHYSHRIEETITIIDQVGSSRIGVCIDFFHMNIEEADIPTSIEIGRRYIDHVQLGDSNRLLPGEGHIDFTSGFAALNRIGYTKYLALECMIPLDTDRQLFKCLAYLQHCLKIATKSIGENSIEKN